MPLCRWHVPTPRDDRLLGKIFGIIRHHYQEEQ
jgi:hypothetical protein